MVLQPSEASSPVRFLHQGEVGWVEADFPPVNALSHAVRQGLLHGLNAAISDPRVKAIALTAKGRTFFAGADIGELDHGVRPPGLMELIQSCDETTKPVLGALFGTVYGGGLVVAYACDWRLAAGDTRFALPELGLGLLPTFGATQWLTRWLGVESTLSLVIDGDVWDAHRALESGFVDRIVEQAQLLDATASLALTSVNKRRISDPRHWRLEDESHVAQAFDRRRDRFAESAPDFEAAWATLELMQSGLKLPIDQALERERQLFDYLLRSVQSKRLRTLFFADRRLRRARGDVDSLAREIQRIGPKDIAALCALAREAVNEGLMPDVGAFDALVVQVLKLARHRPSPIAALLTEVT
jgi:3-hydroxyacyl-CoA dehydrogenase